jgi:hypothetical protein
MEPDNWVKIEVCLSGAAWSSLSLQPPASIAPTGGACTFQLAASVHAGFGS